MNIAITANGVKAELARMHAIYFTWHMAKLMTHARFFARHLSRQTKQRTQKAKYRIFYKFASCITCLFNMSNYLSFLSAHHKCSREYG